MNTWARRFCSFTAVLGLALALLASGGCSSVRHMNAKRDTTLGGKRKVENVHQVEGLPEHLRRVALLPLHLDRYDHLDMSQIEENFSQELIKRNLFEVVTVTAADMQEIFGQPSYSSVKHLPTKLLSKLHHIYGIDGVMLIDVTHFNAYQPVALGVRAKLLDGRSGEIVWAADELFDAANPEVSNAARKYFHTESKLQYPLHNAQTVLHSPIRFSKYVADALFDTIR